MINFNLHMTVTFNFKLFLGHLVHCMRPANCLVSFTPAGGVSGTATPTAPTPGPTATTPASRPTATTPASGPTVTAGTRSWSLRLTVRLSDIHCDCDSAATPNIGLFNPVSPLDRFRQCSPIILHFSCLYPIGDEVLAVHPYARLDDTSLRQYLLLLAADDHRASHFHGLAHVRLHLRACRRLLVKQALLP